MKTIKVPKKYLDTFGDFEYYNDDIKIRGKCFCTFTNRCGAYDDDFNLYILEDKVLRKIDVEETSENRYGKFYWFNDHTQAVVVEENGDVGLVQCRSLDEYVEDCAEPCNNMELYRLSRLLPKYEGNKIKVPQRILNQAEQAYEYKIELGGEEYFLFYDRLGAYDKNHKIYILEDNVLKEVNIESVNVNRYGTFYWFDNHTQAVVKDVNEYTEVFECSSLADYVDRYCTDECFNY